ncbi:MAG: alpha/beta hydrolase [Marmoricola sp.]
MPGLQTTIETLLLRAALGLPERAQRALVRRPVTIDGLTLSPEIQVMLALQRIARLPGLGVQPLRQARASMAKQTELIGGRQSIGALRDLTVDGASGPLAARLYIPASRQGPDPAPTLLFFHGGGHVCGTVETHDAACRFLAEESGVQVLSVEYRLAPEHPFPAAVDDGFAAYQWMLKNTDLLNADPDRLAVGGDSAGGNLAATTAIQAGESGLPLAFQLLIYPVTDFAGRSASRDLFDGGGFVLERPGMDKLHRMYLPEADLDAHPLSSVLLRTSFPEHLAPAYVVTAGFDPLRDEGEAYARLLADHGVQVEAKRYPSMIHGFFNLVGAGREAVSYNREIAAKLRAALA